MLDNIQLSDRPIFIVGNPRSGTTLLQALLSTQSPICSFRETHYFTKIQPKLIVDVTGHIEEVCLAKAFGLLHSILDLQFDNEERDRITTLSKEIKLTSKILFEIVVQKLMVEQHIAPIDSAVWLEKTPDHAFHLKQIYEWYPSARVIHIVRHPIPVIYSMIDKFDFLEDRSVRRLAKRWLNTVKTVDSLSDKYNILTVKYEDIVNDVTRNIELICNYLKIEFDPAALSQYTEKAKVVTMQTEPWKSDVQKKIISNSNMIALNRCTKLSKMLIYWITRKKSIKYGYF